MNANNGIIPKLVKEEISTTENLTLPEFPGGESLFYKYLTDNIKYPPILVKIKLEGDIDISFAVKKDGSIGNINVLKGFDPDADEEVIRVINSMPKWTAAKKDGESVDMVLKLNVTFSLNEDLISQLEKNNNNTDTLSTIANKNKDALIDALKENIQVKSQNEILANDTLNKEPQFPGGKEALETYLKTNLRYPKRALEMKIEGRVVLNVRISEIGEISGIRIFRGLGRDCNDEAVYLVRNMPNWIPGLKDGKPVAMNVVIPIAFELPQ